MREKTVYCCDVCGHEYGSPDEARKCESRGVEKLWVEKGGQYYLDWFAPWYLNFFLVPLGLRLPRIPVKVALITGPQLPPASHVYASDEAPGPHVYRIWIKNGKKPLPYTIQGFLHRSR